MLEDLQKPLDEVQRCKVLERVAEHPDTTEKDVELARQYLDDPNWGAYALANALRRKGINVHKDSITRHREKRCPCW
jgi:hypothetical protein